MRSLSSINSELARLGRELDKIALQQYDILDQIEHPPSPTEFSEAILGSKLDKWQRGYTDNATSTSHVAIAASRQSGKSTVTGLFVAWCLVFIPGFQCLVASRSLRQAAHYLTLVRQAVLSLVPRQAMVQVNRLSMELPNGAQIISIPCAQPDAGRGFSPHLVILDEAAFAPEDLFRAITPSLSATNGALHMLSSPNGRQGYFFEAFEGTAQDVFEGIRVKWTDCPRIRPERMEQEKIALGDLYFRQEYGAEFITPQGAFFGNTGILSFMDEEDPPIGDLENLEIDALLDTILPEPKPTLEDMQQGFDRADRVKRLLVE